LPEIVRQIAFFVSHLLSLGKSLGGWDRKDTAQCELGLPGHDLGTGVFSEFHERRLRGANDNPICTVIDSDDDTSLRALLDEGKFSD
jgi:hypothetical protein